MVKMVDEKKELIDNESEDVSGGYLLDAGRYAGDTSKPFEVIDDADGRVLGRYANRNDAKKMAKNKNQLNRWISYSEVANLRKTSDNRNNEDKPNN